MNNYFAINRDVINYPACFSEKEQRLPAGYGFAAMEKTQVPPKYIKQWAKLRGKAWRVHKNAWVMFILAKEKVVSTMYVTHQDQIGTFHAAFTLPEHRHNGFYKYFLFRGMQYLIDQGVCRFEVYTDKEHLWRVWQRLALERVSTVNKITKW
jgi:hypothetical protein